VEASLSASKSNNDPQNNEIIPASLDVSGDFRILVAGYKGNDFEADSDVARHFGRTSLVLAAGNQKQCRHNQNEKQCDSFDFRILVAGYKGNDFEADSDASTTVEYAIYQRNEWLREYYGLNIISRCPYTRRQECGSRPRHPAMQG